MEHDQKKEMGQSLWNLEKEKAPCLQTTHLILDPTWASPEITHKAAKREKGPLPRLNIDLRPTLCLNKITQPQNNKPTFQPTCAISIDLNPKDNPINIFTDASSSSLPEKSTSPPNLKIPPDITNLSTQTYHEFARNQSSNNQLPQNSMVSRSRERSCSPSRGLLVAGGNKHEDQAQGSVLGELGSVPNLNQTAQETEAYFGGHT